VAEGDTRGERVEEGDEETISRIFSANFLTP
jgi:hypothetical protein